MTFDKRKVKAQIKKAFLVIERTTSKPGPKEYGNSWPHMVREPLSQEDRIPDDDDSYQALLKIKVTPRTVTWAKSVIDAINEMEEDSRKLIYAYFAERMKNRTDEEFSKKIGKSRQALDKQLTPLLQELEEVSCRNVSKRHPEHVDDVYKTPHNSREKSEPRPERKSYWRSEDARGSVEDFVEVAAE